LPLSDAPESLAPAAVEERDRTHVLPTYARTPFHPRSGKGAKLVDADGREYWDLLGGIAVNALGYRHPRLVKAMKEEATGVWHVSNLFYIPAQGLLAERLVRASGLSRVFFCNTGTEAIEAALKFARLKNPGRSRIVALEEGFHGRTFGALSITGHEPYRTPFEPLVPSAVFVPPNDAAALEEAVTADTSAIVLEPILGEGGIIPLTPEYVAAARRAADRTGALLVFDEIQSGLGRTGHLFVFRELGVVPDLVTLAKPLGGGLPLGAVLSGPALDGLLKPGLHGTTFGGNPVACRLGLEVLDEIQNGGLLSRVSDLGAWFGKAARRLKKKQPAIADVRGRGLIWGIELDREASPVQKKLLAKGYVVGTARSKVLRLLPPYVVPKAALRGFLATVDEILKETSA
jgi:predicted acetylornithine/succinylornithine family transaminase